MNDGQIRTVVPAGRPAEQFDQFLVSGTKRIAQFLHVAIECWRPPGVGTIVAIDRAAQVKPVRADQQARRGNRQRPADPPEQHQGHAAQHRPEGDQGHDVAHFGSRAFAHVGRNRQGGRNV